MEKINRKIEKKGIVVQVFNENEKLHIDTFDKVTILIEKSFEALESFFWGSSEKDLKLDRKKYPQIEFCITICNEERIQDLNREFRFKDKVTDVLSFPVHDSLRPGAFIQDIEFETLSLGDIFICHEVALKQAEEFDIQYAEEVAHLYFHGLLHLCGFDHEISKAEADEMFYLEGELVKSILE